MFGDAAERLPNTLCFAVPGLDAPTALIAFDLAGVAVSSGSACSSGKVARSPVLAAMGVSPALAAGALRVSLGWNTGEGDTVRFLGAFERVVETLYKRRGLQRPESRSDAISHGSPRSLKPATLRRR